MCAPQIEGTDEAYCKCTAGFMGPDCTAAYMECDKGLVCYNGGQCTAGDSPDTQTCGCPRECRAWWFHLCAVRSRGSFIAPAVTCNGCLRLLPTRHAVHATNSAAGSGHPAGGVIPRGPASLSLPPGVGSQPLPCVFCSVGAGPRMPAVSHRCCLDLTPAPLWCPPPLFLAPPSTANWTGATCKVPVVFCGNSTDFHCMNGGQCMYDQTAKEYYCKCAPNVRGRHCQFGECCGGAGAWATGAGAGPGTQRPGG